MSFPEHIKKAAIFFFYDQDGIVDDYIDYLLSNIKNNIDYLLVVCNGKLTSRGREKFSKLADDLLVRENKGFDAWAYKDGLEIIGWDNLVNLDELILFNFTIFGPLYPFEEMFLEMNKRDVDFWGITSHHEIEFDPFGIAPLGYIPEHIESHWIALRKSILKSREFYLYWKNLPEINTYEESICYHESLFTKHFNDIGFLSDVYVDTSNLKDINAYPLIFQAKKLIKEMRCPILKRRNYFNDYNDVLKQSLGEITLEVHNYIKDHGLYDIGYIYKNIIRTQNQATVKKLLHQNYIINEKHIYNELRTTPKVALILHIYYEELISYCYSYAQSIPEFSDVYITVDTQEKKKLVESIFANLICNKLEVLIIENRGRDVAALLVGSKMFIQDYDLVCFAHDKKVQQIKPYSIGESFSYKCFESILSTPNLVKNILCTFEEDPYLGMLVPPPPNHSIYYPTVGNEWTCNYDNCKDLVDKLGIDVPISKELPSTAPLGTMFWFRPKALKTLFDKDWEYDDFPPEPNELDGTILHAIERIYPLIAQYEGYTVGWVMSDKVASIEYTNLYEMLSRLNKVMFQDLKLNYAPILSVLEQLQGLEGALGVLKNDINNKNDISFRMKVKNKLRPFFPTWFWNMVRDMKRKVF